MKGTKGEDKKDKKKPRGGWYDDDDETQTPNTKGSEKDKDQKKNPWDQVGKISNNISQSGKDTKETNNLNGNNKLNDKGKLSNLNNNSDAPLSFPLSSYQAKTNESTQKDTKSYPLM